MAIPKIIHHLWKDEALPERYVAFRDSWRRLNPGWELRLWTDRDLLALVETRYPEWLAIYTGYERNISRADLGRYLVLREFGGVYADLDCKCLKPMETLLGEEDYAIGLEPQSHLWYYGVDYLICISFIASAPKHTFWEAVLGEVRASVGQADVMHQTGPLLVNRAYAAFPAKDRVRLLPPEAVYPFTDAQARSGQAHDIELWERATRDAHVAHYWDSTWGLRIKPPGGLPRDIPASLNRVAAAPDPDSDRSISCLMVSSGRLDLARPAIDDFLRQTHPDRELIIGAAAPEAALERHVRALGHAEVRLAVLTGPPEPVSGPFAPELIAAARGDLLCVWEEGALHDPRRLELQQGIRQATQSRACLMRRRLIWQPGSARLGVSADRPLAGSVLAGKVEMQALAAQTASGRPWLDRLAETVRTAAFDTPRLTLQVDDSGDSGAAAAFEADWQAASTRFAADRVRAVLEELASRLAIASRFADAAFPQPFLAGV